MTAFTSTMNSASYSLTINGMRLRATKSRYFTNISFKTTVKRSSYTISSMWRKQVLVLRT